MLQNGPRIPRSHKDAGLGVRRQADYKPKQASCDNLTFVMFALTLKIWAVDMLIIMHGMICALLTAAGPILELAMKVFIHSRAASDALG